MRSRRHTKARMVVVGDINIDVLARVKALTALGGDYLCPRLDFHCGGVGANTAIALAKWGTRVQLVGAAGRDWFGDLALKSLRRQGVDVSHVQRTLRALTGLMFVAIDPQGERTFFGSRGANAELRLSGSKRIPARVHALHLVGYTFLSPVTEKAARSLLQKARRTGSGISLDVGMAPSLTVPGKILRMARKVDILLLSQAEAKALTGQRHPAKMLRKLSELGPSTIVLRLGSRGCLISHRNKALRVPTFPVSVVDTTGCGDAATAAFLHAHWAGWPPQEAALLANAAGAAAATQAGAGESMPTPGRVLRLLKTARLSRPWDAVRQRLLRRLRSVRKRKPRKKTGGGPHG